MTKLERAALDALYLRAREWKKDNPDGMLPRGHPLAIKSTITRNFVKAALAYYDAREKKP